MVDYIADEGGESSHSHHRMEDIEEGNSTGPTDQPKEIIGDEKGGAESVVQVGGGGNTSGSTANVTSDWWHTTWGIDSVATTRARKV